MAHGPRPPRSGGPRRPMRLPLLLLAAAAAALMARGAAAADLFVWTQPENAAAKRYTNLADAVSAAASGDTIWICAGTYDLSGTTKITKTVSIKGSIPADCSSTAVQDLAATPAVLDCKSKHSAAGKHLWVFADNVLISGIHITNVQDKADTNTASDSGIYVDAGYRGLTITNCKFSNFYSQSAIFGGQAGMTITGSTFSGGSKAITASANIPNPAAPLSLRVEGCKFEGLLSVRISSDAIAYGWALDIAVPTATSTDVVFIKNEVKCAYCFRGAAISGASTATVSDNTFIQETATPDKILSNGILVTDCSTCTIQNNIFTAASYWDVMLRIIGQTRGGTYAATSNSLHTAPQACKYPWTSSLGTNCGGLTVNDLTPGPDKVVIVNAKQNWWGTAAGAILEQNVETSSPNGNRSTNVDTSSPLPTGANLRTGTGQPGFEPDTRGCATDNDCGVTEVCTKGSGQAFGACTSALEVLVNGKPRTGMFWTANEVAARPGGTIDIDTSATKCPSPLTCDVSWKFETCFQPGMTVNVPATGAKFSLKVGNGPGYDINTYGQKTRQFGCSFRAFVKVSKSGVGGSFVYWGFVTAKVELAPPDCTGRTYNVTFLKENGLHCKMKRAINTKAVALQPPPSFDDPQGNPANVTFLKIMTNDGTSQCRGCERNDAGRRVCYPIADASFYFGVTRPTLVPHALKKYKKLPGQVGRIFRITFQAESVAGTCTWTSDICIGFDAALGASYCKEGDNPVWVDATRVNNGSGIVAPFRGPRN